MFGAAKSKVKAQRKEVVNIDQLAEMFNLPSSEEAIEHNETYIGEAGAVAYRQAIEDGEDEDKADELSMKAQEEAETEIFGHWHGGVEAAATELFEAHKLTLVPSGKGRYPYQYRVEPMLSWLEAANAIRTTINGVGYFEFHSVNEFLRSGPYTSRQAVLNHLGAIRDYPAVYGTSSARSIYGRSW